MNKFDEKIMKMAKDERFDIPDDAKDRIDAALETLPEISRKTKVLTFPRAIAGVVCAAVLALVVMPNMSTGYAAAMQNVPIIGSIVRVCTVRNFMDYDVYHLLDVQMPELYSDAINVADVNQSVEELTTRLMNEFYAQLDNGGTHSLLKVEHSVVTDTPEWFTLRLDVEQTQASGYAYSRYYHIDKRTGESVQLKDLFDGDKYIEVLSKELVQQMRDRMDADAEAVYDIDSSDFTEKLQDTMPERNFYFNSDGELVLVFDEYEIAPGYMGIQEFVIEKEEK